MVSDRPLPDAGEVRVAAATLRPLEREVLVLAAGERLSNEAIARRLGLSPRKVRRLLARALRKLDRALEQQEWR